MGDVVWVLRICLAMGIGLSAWWKLSHPFNFAAAFRGLAPRKIAKADSWALWPVALMESSTACLVVVGQYVAPFWWVGPAAALCLISTFTIALGLACVLLSADAGEDHESPTAQARST